ncbi:MAG: hypothetical protein WA902_22540 [Thermosynechococcaceae cyanobacterium]
MRCHNLCSVSDPSRFWFHQHYAKIEERDLAPDEQTVFVYGSDQSVQIFDEQNPREPLPVLDFCENIDLKVEAILDWLKG